jgi:tRNA (uracil-5-)-methyltransferase
MASTTPDATPKMAEVQLEQKEMPANDNASCQTILDHSNRKVIIYNIDKYMKIKAIEKKVQEWIKDTDVKVSKTKKPPKNNWIVLTLEDESMVETFMNILNNGTHFNKKGGALEAKRPVEATGDANKRSRDGNDDRATKRMRQEPVECVKTPAQVRDKLTPLWKMSYEDQLDQKTKTMVNKCLSKITSEIKRKFHTLQREQRRSGSKAVDPVYGWLKVQNTIKMEPILAAPKQLEYRNKCELTFGYNHAYEVDENGVPIEIEVAATEESSSADADAEKKMKIVKTPAVGFMAGGWAGGVSDPHCLANIPDVVCGIADVINEFLKTSSVPPYKSTDHRGVWRTVTIRSSERTKQCMVIITHAPPSGGAGKKDDGSDDCTDVFEGEKQRLVKMLMDKIPKPTRTYAEGADATKEGESCDIGVTSLFFQEFDGLSNPLPQHPVQHICGKEFIEEKLLQCDFQVSPGAFFQVTTEGAEKLYSVVVDKLKEVTTNPKDTVLFDVCCGTGTIGLTCMKEGAVGKVVGIDISEPAIKDAVINAERNGFSGSDEITRFVASRAELVMYEEVKKVGHSCPMVAVVDPAREGLHQDVIKTLRNQAGLQRIVYVSCNPTGSLIVDAGLLCSPATKKYRGLPFKISSSQPVDMFPLTDHCEMVMVFDRMTQKECDGDDEKADVESNASKDVDMKSTEEEDKPVEETE